MGITGIQNEQAKVTKSIKDSAKKGDTDSCRILAKEVIRAKKAVNKLYASKAQLSSVDMSMKNQLATLRVSGSLEKSTEVMRYMQQLVKLPEIQATMQELSKEMMKVSGGRERWGKVKKMMVERKMREWKKGKEDEERKMRDGKEDEGRKEDEGMKGR